jgi:hypothetical protein
VCSRAHRNAPTKNHHLREFQLQTLYLRHFALLVVARAVEAAIRNINFHRLICNLARANARAVCANIFAPKMTDSASSSSSSSSSKKSKSKRRKDATESETPVDVDKRDLNAQQLHELEELHTWMLAQPGSQYVSTDEASALKFFRGTKLRLEKAKDKYTKMVTMRELFGDASLEAVAPVLGMGTMQCDPAARDKDGRAIVYVLAEYVIPELDSGYQRVRAFAYILDLLMEQKDVQQNGLTCVLDFANTPFRMNNSAQKNLNALFDAMPLRFGAGYFVNTPWWFSIAFRIVSNFTRSKMIARVRTRDVAANVCHEDISLQMSTQWPESLPTYIPTEHLLPRFGGTSKFDHRAFLRARFEAEGVPLPGWVKNVSGVCARFGVC